MSTTVRCPKCSALLRLGREAVVGSQVRCASCEHVFPAAPPREDRPTVLSQARPADGSAHRRMPSPDSAVEQPVVPSQPQAHPARGAAMPVALPFTDGVPIGQEQVSLLDYWGVIKRRRWWFAAAAILILASAAVWTHFQEPLYRATTTLIVEPDIPEMQSFTGASSRELTTQFYTTQYAIIRSDTVLKKVYAIARLDQDPTFAQRPDPVSMLRRRVSVDPVPDSRLVKVSVDHGSRERALPLATVLASPYIEHSIEDRRAASRNAFDWLSRQIDILKGKVEQSELALLDYKSQEDIISLERRRELLEERLAGLATDYNTVLGELLELETTIDEVERIRQDPLLLESLPRSLETPLIQSLKHELSELHLEQAKISQRYKPKHPKIVSLEAQVGQTEARLADEVDKIYQSLEIEHRIASSRAETINRTLDETKQESMQVAELAIQFRVLGREADSNRQIYDVLLQRLREADISGSVAGQNIRVLDAATAAHRPFTPRTSLNMTLALIAAIVLGVALCFVAEQIDNTLKNDEDVTQHLQETVIGLVPRQKGRPDLDPEPAEPLVAAYGGIKTTLQFYAREHILQTLLITSALRAEGKSLSAAFVATAFAKAGSKVLLIDADMFQATLGKRLQVSQEVGLSDYFLNDADTDQIVLPTSVPNLDLIPAGKIPPDPAAPLGTAAMRSLIETMKGFYDLVIIDSPPLTATLDVGHLAAIADGVIMIVKASSTSKPLVRRALAQLRIARANVLGVVLTSAEVPPEHMSYYSYEYQRAQA